MRLKDIGNLNNATSAITGVANAFGRDLITSNSDPLDALKDALSGTTIDTAKLAAVQLKLDDAQIKTILSAKGLKGATLESAVATASADIVNKKAVASTNGLKVAMSGLWHVIKTNPIIWITAILAGAFMAFKKIEQSQKELAESTRESAQTAKSQSDSIDDYTKRYQELHKALLEARGDEEATKNIKEQLLALQKEINGQFGDEYGKLNLVTSAYRDQTEAIKGRNKEIASEYLNKNQKGNEQAKKEMYGDFYDLSSKNLSNNNASDRQLMEIAKRFEDRGIRVHENLDDMDNGEGTYYIRLYADPESAKDTINDFMNEVQTLDMNSSLEKELNISSNSLSKALQSIEDFGEQYKLTLQYEVITNDTLSPLYEEAQQAVDAYNSAILNSSDPFNDSNVKSAYKAMKDIEGAVKESGEGWTTYKSVFDDVFDEVDTRIYEFAQRVKGGDFQKGIDKASTKSITELRAMADAGDTSNPFVEMIEGAKEYGLEVEDVIGVLKELGIVQEESIAPGFDLTKLEDQVKTLSDSKALLDKAISEQNQNGTLSSETIDELRLKYENFNQIIEVTTTGTRINTSALAELNAEEKKNIQDNFGEKYEDLIKTFKKTSMCISEYRKELTENENLTDAQRYALEALIAAKETEQNTTQEQITELQFLQAEYDNVISKHNAFMNAMNATDIGDGYDGVQSKLSQVKEIWNDGGVGSDKIRTFVDYMSYNDMSTASIEEITAAYHEAMKAAELYFTEGSAGSERFLHLLKDAEGQYATLGEDGKWEINIEDINAAAEDLGYSVDFIKDNLDKLNYYGFEVDFDMNFDSLDDSIDSINDKIDAKKKEIEELKKINPDIDTSELDAELDHLLGIRREFHFQVRLDEKQGAIEEIIAIQKQIDELTKSSTYSMPSATLAPEVLKEQEDTLNQLAELKARQEELAQNNKITVEFALDSGLEVEQDGKPLIDIQEFDNPEITVVADTEPAKEAINHITDANYSAKINLVVGNTPAILSNPLGIPVNTGGGKNTNKNDSNNSTVKKTGTTQASWTGSALADGSWKVGYTGKALVGELGKELLVRDGKAFPIGTNGAEFVNLHSDDIIFNHVQTRQLERNGKINTRGRAFSLGSVPAFNTGGSTFNRIPIPGTANGTIPNSSSSSVSNIEKAAKSAKKVTDETKKQSKEFEWIKKALDYISRQRERISDEVEYENNSYKEQLSYLKELLAIDKEMIATNEAALANYANQWAEICQKILEAFGAEEGNSLIAKIMRGDVSADGWKDIFEYDSNDEVMQQKIELIDDANNIYSSLTDQEEKYKEAQRKYTEDLQKQYEIRINMIKAYLDEVQSDMDKAESSLKMKETTGRMITESDYKEMIRLAEKQIDLYHDQIDTLEEKLDEQEEGTEEYYRTQSQIASCKNAISQCEQKQAEWNEEILNLPIRRIERYLELLELIKRDMTNKLDEQDALGINATKEQLQSLIDITKQQIDKLKEQHEAVVKKLPNYEFGSDKYNETKKEIQDIEDSVSDLIQSQIEYNQQLLNIPLEKISKLTDRLQNVKDALSEIADGYDTAVSTVTKTIDKQIDSINDLKDSSEESYEAMIKPLQEQLDLLSKQNAERKVQLALEQAQYDLERAKNQKITQVRKIA